jgi:pyridoxal phosphate enzyme (YggS family)
MDIDVIASNLETIRARVRRGCDKNNVDPKTIKIVGVTKTLPVEIAVLGVNAGLTDLGENRIQEAVEKIPEISPRPTWHLIGHLQKNKARKAVELFDVIQSVDSVELADILSKRAIELEKKLEIYLQVNSSGEISKSGFDKDEILPAAETIRKLPGLNLAGLMTIGPWTDDEDMIKTSFELTQNLFVKMKQQIGDSFNRLSMGMSGDYELALDYGANTIRIGTAIFGPRGLK